MNSVYEGLYVVKRKNLKLPDFFERFSGEEFLRRNLPMSDEGVFAQNPFPAWCEQAEKNMNFGPGKMLSLEGPGGSRSAIWRRISRYGVYG
jgi:hypothetical protein